MIVLWCRVGKQPELLKIDGSLKSMQNLVGGLIEPVYCFDDDKAVLLCNEEGLILQLPLNRKINGHFIFGDFFICGLGEETFTDLPKNFLCSHITEIDYFPSTISVIVNENMGLEESMEYLL